MFLMAMALISNKLKELCTIVKRNQKSIKESMYDISWVEEENKLEISKWYLKNKGFYFLDGEKQPSLTV